MSEPWPEEDDWILPGLIPAGDIADDWNGADDE